MNIKIEHQPDLAALHAAAENYEWVEDDQHLARLCQQWRQHPLIGMDTEFQRTDTFYPKPGLIQVACEGACYLLDPLAIDDFEPFVELMNDASVIKVFHACTEDLELFSHSYGCSPKSLFDSQVACSFLGMGLSIGYQRLLNEMFGVELGKEETRSDWLQRPLTDSQKLYASLDVVYLQPVYDNLAALLKQQDKYQWVSDECDGLADAALVTDDVKTSYLTRFKQSWKLRPQQLSVLQALCEWREEESRLRDMPRNFLLHNASLMAIAMKPPKTLAELSAVERMRKRLLSSDGKVLLKIIAQAWGRDEVLKAPPRPLPTALAKQMKPLKGLVNEVAEKLGVAPEILVKRKDMEQLIRSGMDGQPYSLTAGLKGWRESVIGQPLLAQIQQIESDSVTDSE